MQASTEQIDKITKSLVKACSDMSLMTRDGMNAVLQSVTAMVRGYEELCDSVNSLLQKSLEDGAQAGKAIVNAKTLQDLMDANTSLIKNSFDNVVSEMNRISRLSSRLAQDISDPVAQQMNAAIIKLSQSKAA